METKKRVTGFLLILFFCSCHSVPDQEANFETADVLLSPPPPPANEAMLFEPPVISDENAEGGDREQNEEKVFPVNKKKIIRDGNISVKSLEIATSKRKIDEVLKSLKGYYDREEFLNDEASISFSLTIRIPSENFETLISAIEEGKDEITNKSIEARDVTEEYLDIETRLANKKEYLKRYKELLSKASTVKDILEIEENIRTIQEEVESKEGRLKYLYDQVAYSTLYINLFKKKEFAFKPQQPDKFSERVKKSLNAGWVSVVNFSLWTIKVWPFIFLTLVSLFIIKLLIKKRKVAK